MQMGIQAGTQAAPKDAAADRQPLFTLFVPTYNRRTLLPRLLESVEAQTFRDFELLIVDDGSQDGSYEYLCEYQQQSQFRMRVIYQENQGKPIAFNTALESAQGLLFTMIDSDDILHPEAMERFAYWWQVAQEYKENPPIVGVEGLCASMETRQVIGTFFPKSPLVADHIEIYYRRGCWGDAVRAVRTDIIGQYRFPRIPNERYIPPSYLWNRLGFDRHKILYFNQVISYKEYRKDGISKNRYVLRARNPYSAELYFRDFIELAYRDGRVTWRQMVRHTANWVRYSLCIDSLRNTLRRTYQASNFPVWAVGAPLGILLYLNDRRLLKRR